MPFDPAKYEWVSTGPGQWTVRSKDATPSKPAGYMGPSARDLIGGDISFSLGGGVEFGPEDVSPRPEAPSYGG